jgi:hypothetical protein
MSGNAVPNELLPLSWLAEEGAIVRGPVASESVLQALEATTMPPTMNAVAIRNFLEMCI